MNKNIPHNNKLIPSNEGWQQMQLLLDQHLPLKKQHPRFKLIILYSAATIFIFMLLCISLQLDKIVMPVRSLNNSLVTQITINKQPSAKLLPGQRTAISTSPFVKKEDGILIDKNQFAPAGYEYNSIAHKVDQGAILEKHAGGQIEIQLPEKQPSTVIVALHNLNDLPPKNTKRKTPENGSWHFYAGVGLNVSLNHTQPLQPYPTVEVRYHTNRKFYFAMGLSTWSRVSTIAGGISKTVYLNDTANNIRLYNEVTGFKHPQYVDIPLSAGLNITKHFSVSGGVQLSVLMNKQTEKVLEPYDYQMNSVPNAVLPIAITTGRAEQQYNVQAKKMDYRFITSLQYTQGKFAGGLTYQYAFKPAANGLVAKHNNLVSLSVLFKIK